MFGIGAFAQTPFASLANIFHDASVTENSGLADAAVVSAAIF
jgi:hypothetical protein